MQEVFVRDLIRWAKELSRQGWRKWDALVTAARIFQSGDCAWRGRTAEEVARAWVEMNVEGCQDWMGAGAS